MIFVCLYGMFVCLFVYLFIYLFIYLIYLLYLFIPHLFMHSFFFHNCSLAKVSTQLLIYMKQIFSSFKLYVMNI